MRFSRKAAVSAAVVGSALVLGAAPALADSGQVYSVGANARSIFNDQNDVVTACDRAADGHGAVGWIAVQQANGSWKAFPHVYNGGGSGTCRSVDFDVIREASPLRLYSCQQDGATGTPYRCGVATLAG